MKLLSLMIVLTLLSLTACSRGGAIDPSSPAAPGAPAGGGDGGKKRDALGANGTVSTGGGNGLQGRAIEDFNKDIELLPEYKHYIVPILRRLSQGRADVLLVYLKWTTRNKAWYFVPAELPELPKERTALAFKSVDQLALHGEKEIFIDSELYDKQTEKQKAWLLLHEMVMGAKFLMQKSPKTQCQFLSGAIDPNACNDEAMMKLAPSDREGGTSDAIHTLDARDHESVRTMTIYLMDPKQEVNAVAIAALRNRLQFNFPWEAVLSNVSFQDLRTALERTKFANVTFTSIDSASHDSSAQCAFNLNKSASVDTLAISETHLSADGTRTAERQSLDWLATDRSTPTNAVGVVDPGDPRRMVDRIEFEPFNGFYHWQTEPVDQNGNPIIQQKLQFYLTRDDHPRIIEFRVVPVRVRKIETVINGFASQEFESIEVQGAHVLRCRAVSN